MTVGELITELQKHPDDMLVSTSGADFGGYDVEFKKDVLVLPFQDYCKCVEHDYEYWKSEYGGTLYVGG